MLTNLVILYENPIVLTEFYRYVDKNCHDKLEMMERLDIIGY